MLTRAERVVYFIPDRTSTVENFARLADAVNASDEDMYFALITNKQAEEISYDRHCFHFIRVECMHWPRCVRTASGRLDRSAILDGCR
jgi:hypothetical protein